MSITDELREWARNHTVDCSDNRIALVTIAKRIDAEHESACAEAYGNGVMSVPIALDESAWVKLPKDADGEYIHIGDKVILYGRQVYEVDAILFFKNNVSVSYKGESGCGCDSANNFRHYHAPTVEDVLREFALKAAGRECMTIRSELVDEYAAKLRLREDA